MDAATYKRLRAMGLSDRDVREFYTLDDTDSDEGGDVLETWAQQEALMRHRRPLAELTLEQREQVYRMVARESGYGGANTAKQLMGVAPSDPSGYASYGTIDPDSPYTLPYEPTSAPYNRTESAKLQAQAEAYAAARGESLAELSVSDPQLAQKLYRMAAAAISYAGAQGKPPAYSAWPGDPDEVEGDDFDDSESD